MTDLTQVMLIVYVSPDGNEPWSPVKPELVQEWLKQPDVIQRLLSGEMAQDNETQVAWYRAERYLPVIGDGDK